MHLEWVSLRARGSPVYDRKALAERCMRDGVLHPLVRLRLFGNEFVEGSGSGLLSHRDHLLGRAAAGAHAADRRGLVMADFVVADGAGLNGFNFSAPRLTSASFAIK